MSIILTILIVILGLLTIHQTFFRILRKRVNLPVPPFMGRVLDSDFRRMLQPPSKIIKRSGIRPGMKVLEIGCGSGAYTEFVCEAVGEGGKVYALDIQEEMLEQLRKKIERSELKKRSDISLVCANAYDMPFSGSTFDLAYMILSLQEIPDKQKALKEARRVLKPDGLISVTEFLPDPDYPLRSTTKKELENAGFEIKAVQGNLWSYTVTGIKV